MKTSWLQKIVYACINSTKNNTCCHLGNENNTSAKEEYLGMRVVFACMHDWLMPWFLFPYVEQKWVEVLVLAPTKSSIRHLKNKWPEDAVVFLGPRGRRKSWKFSLKMTSKSFFKLKKYFLYYKNKSSPPGLFFFLISDFFKTQFQICWDPPLLVFEWNSRKLN